MSDFTRWSKWFECGLELKRHKTHALAVMAWIASHASSDGSGIEFNPEVWASLAEEVGLAPEEGKTAVDALIAEGLLAGVGQETPDLLVVRAVL
jgi:hypothetical protein